MMRIKKNKNGSDKKRKKATKKRKKPKKGEGRQRCLIKSEGSAASAAPVGVSRGRIIENIEAHCKILHADAPMKGAADLIAPRIPPDPIKRAVVALITGLSHKCSKRLPKIDGKSPENASKSQHQHQDPQQHPHHIYIHLYVHIRIRGLQRTRAFAGIVLGLVMAGTFIPGITT